eukprot:5228720-Pleurochrysis_carterae.AAC.1
MVRSKVWLTCEGLCNANGHDFHIRLKTAMAWSICGGACRNAGKSAVDPKAYCILETLPRRATQGSFAKYKARGSGLREVRGLGPSRGCCQSNPVREPIRVYVLSATAI